MAVSPIPAIDHEDNILTLEELSEDSKADEEAGEPETCEVKGPAVSDDGRHVDGGERDTKLAVEAQVAERAPDFEAGYEADNHRHEVEQHQPFLQP